MKDSDRRWSLRYGLEKKVRVRVMWEVEESEGEGAERHKNETALFFPPTTKKFLFGTPTNPPRIAFVMAANESALRLKFLQSSANLLGTSGVSTAGHLMTQHNRLIHADSKPLKPRQHESWCGACGTPRDSAYTKISKTKRRVTSRKNGSESRGALEEAVVYHCLRCHKQSIRRVQSNVRQQREQSSISVDTQPKAVSTNQRLSTPSTTPGSSTSVAADMSSASATAKPASDNANSKKRAKARKQGGLQALMASKQRSQASNSGSSLDLLDFLQQ